MFKKKGDRRFHILRVLRRNHLHTLHHSRVCQLLTGRQEGHTNSLKHRWQSLTLSGRDHQHVVSQEGKESCCWPFTPGQHLFNLMHQEVQVPKKQNIFFILILFYRILLCFTVYILNAALAEKHCNFIAYCFLTMATSGLKNLFYQIGLLPGLFLLHLGPSSLQYYLCWCSLVTKPKYTDQK